jgi:hypothetical protein
MRLSSFFKQFYQLALQKKDSMFMQILLDRNHGVMQHDALCEARRTSKELASSLGHGIDSLHDSYESTDSEYPGLSRVHGLIQS